MKNYDEAVGTGPWSVCPNCEECWCQSFIIEGSITHIPYPGQKWLDSHHIQLIFECGICGSVWTVDFKQVHPLDILK